MKQHIVLRTLLAFGIGLLLSVTAQAQSFRTYLSSTGTANPNCTLAAPCRLLPEALAAVADGGEVWMLDSANYNTGPVDVNKSVTILAVPGALGSVVALGGNAINISTASVKVALRNLVIVPFVGSSSSGVFMTAGASLTVENCLIANLAVHGIYVSANGASVLVTDTMIRGNGMYGLNVGGGARVTMTRVTISGNSSRGVNAWAGIAGSITTVDIVDSTIDALGVGVYAYSSDASALVKVSVRDSQVVRNSAMGITAQSDSGGSVSLSASNNAISNNIAGLRASGTGARVWASGNTVSNNTIGLSNLSGLFESAGDNAVRNNGTDSSGVITPIPKL